MSEGMTSAILVELFGLPRSGKTTTAKALVDHFAMSDIRVHLVVERASVCPIPDKLHPLFNLWTVSALCREYFAACGRGVDVVISDRGLLDALVWAELFGEGRFPMEVASIRKLAQTPILCEASEVGYFFRNDLNVVIARHSESQATPREGRVVNHQVLEGYLNAYERLLPQFTVPIVQLDTAQLSIAQVIHKVTEDLTSRLKIRRENGRPTEKVHADARARLTPELVRR